MRNLKKSMVLPCLLLSLGLASSAASTASCYPDYKVTGVGQLTSTVTTPEPSTLLMLIGAALLATAVLGRKLSSR